MAAVRTVQTLAAWQALQPAWKALASADDKASLCNTWEWNDAWVQQFWQPHFEFLVYVVEASDHAEVPLALLPLYINRNDRRVLLIGTGEPEVSEVASEYLNLLLDESRISLKEVSSLLLPLLRGLRGLTLRFVNCLESSRLLQLTASLPLVERKVVGRQYGIALSQSLKELMQNFSYKQRKNGQLLLNRFDRTPAFSCEILIDAADSGLWPQLRELHQADWTARQKQGAFAAEDFNAFHLSLQRNNSDLQARFSVLKHADEVIAVHYYYQFRHYLYYYQSGTVKDRFQQYSPGKMLHMLAFRQLTGSGLYYDFMKGAVSGSYKAAMCPAGELFYEVVVHSAGPVGFVRWSIAAAKRWLKATFNRESRPRP